MTDLIKPTTATLVYYDYHKMAAYIDAKYGIDQRDYANKFNKKAAKDWESRPYQDFWHWILEAAWYGDINNGSYAQVNFAELIETAEEQEGSAWVVEILKLYEAEFGSEWLNVHIWW